MKLINMPVSLSHPIISTRWFLLAASLRTRIAACGLAELYCVILREISCFLVVTPSRGDRYASREQFVKRPAMISDP